MKTTSLHRALLSILFIPTLLSSTLYAAQATEAEIQLPEKNFLLEGTLFINMSEKDILTPPASRSLEAVLPILHENLAIPNSTICHQVITGPEGSGKTKIAQLYIKRNRNKYGTVCWFGKRADREDESLAGMVKVLKQAKGDNVLQTFYEDAKGIVQGATPLQTFNQEMEARENITGKPSLIIFDDGPSPTRGKKVREWFIGNKRIIIISCNDIGWPGDTRIRRMPLTDEESIAYLGSRITAKEYEKKEVQEDLQKIVGKVGGNLKLLTAVRACIKAGTAPKQVDNVEKPVIVNETIERIKALCAQANQEPRVFWQTLAQHDGELTAAREMLGSKTEQPEVRTFLFVSSFVQPDMPTIPAHIMERLQDIICQRQPEAPETLASASEEVTDSPQKATEVDQPVKGRESQDLKQQLGKSSILSCNADGSCTVDAAHAHYVSDMMDETTRDEIVMLLIDLLVYFHNKKHCSEEQDRLLDSLWNHLGCKEPAGALLALMNDLNERKINEGCINRSHYLKGAITVGESCNAQLPTRACSHTLAGVDAYKRGEYVEAEDYFGWEGFGNPQLNGSGYQAEAYYYLAKCFSEKGYSTEAKRYFQNVLNILFPMPDSWTQPYVDKPATAPTSLAPKQKRGWAFKERKAVPTQDLPTENADQDISPSTNETIINSDTATSLSSNESTTLSPPPPSLETRRRQIRQLYMVAVSLENIGREDEAFKHYMRCQSFILMHTNLLGKENLTSQKDIEEYKGVVSNAIDRVQAQTLQQAGHPSLCCFPKRRS